MGEVLLMIKKLNKQDSFQDRQFFNNHRCFVISDMSSEDKHLAVNISSIYTDDGYDRSCIITENEFTPYIYKKSFIYYKYAMEIDNEIIIDDNTSIIIIPSNLLNKIQNGAKISKFFPRRLKKYFDLF